MLRAKTLVPDRAAYQFVGANCSRRGLDVIKFEPDRVDEVLLGIDDLPGGGLHGGKLCLHPLQQLLTRRCGSSAVMEFSDELA